MHTINRAAGGFQHADQRATVPSKKLPGSSWVQCSRAFFPDARKHALGPKSGHKVLDI